LTDTIPTGVREWRKFGLLFLGVFVLLAAYLLWKGYAAWWISAVAGAVFGGTGVVAPSVLRWPYYGWMKFAGVLGWVNTRVLLTLFFFLVLTPVGLVMWLFRRDALGRRLAKGSASYWERREEKAMGKERFENEF
jgi:hypothetical protein